MRPGRFGTALLMAAAFAMAWGLPAQAAQGNIDVRVAAEGTYKLLVDSMGHRLAANGGETFLLLVVLIQNFGRDPVPADPSNFVLDTKTSHALPEALPVSLEGAPACAAGMAVPPNAALQCLLIFQVVWDNSGDLTYSGGGQSVRVRFYKCGITDSGDYAAQYSPPCL